MLSLKGDNIYLRALETKDLDFLYQLENATEIWEVSNTITPYSKDVLALYLENAHRDIYEVKQLRLAISSNNHEIVGLIDLFDFDPKNNRVGMGIVVLDKNNRNNGVGAAAIKLLSSYAFSSLGMHQVYANVLEDNAASIHLFKKMGFMEAGVKKDWSFFNGKYKNEILFQKFK